MQEARAPERRTNPERSRATRAALVAAARTLFVESGYAETGTPELVRAAAVTRGALYHHFPDKRALFAAVVEAEAAAVAAEIERATPADLPPLEALARGGEAALAAMSVPGRTRLLLVDAPAVLGRAELDAIDARHGGRTLAEGLAAAMDTGDLRRLPVAPLGAALSAVFDRAALAIEQGADPGDWRAVLAGLLDGLKPSAPAAPVPRVRTMR